MSWRQWLAQMECFLEWILAIHPAALRLLLGEVDPPSYAEIRQWIETFQGAGGSDSEHVDGGCAHLAREEILVMQADELESLMDRFGGWAGIVAATQEIRAREPQGWNLFAEHVLWATGDCSPFPTARIAEDFSVDPRTVRRWRQKIPKLIAKRALQGDGILVS